MPDEGRPDPDDERAAWQQRRREASAEHADVLARRKSAETEQARAQLAAFVRTAQDRGITPTPLRARAFNGRTTYRTGLTGWYLKRNRSLAVDADGNFYVLSTQTSIISRLRGATVRPSNPPLVVGVGGRDGESMPLQQLLDLRLQAGDGWR